MMGLHLDPGQGSHVAPAFHHATVGDAMRRGVVSCPPEAPGVDVARLMTLRHIHAVVVAGIQHEHGGAERLAWGIVTDADVLSAGAAGAGLDGVTAADLARTPPVTTGPQAPLGEAAQAMVEAGVTHLVVVDGGRPVGVLSTLDVAGVLAWGRG